MREYLAAQHKREKGGAPPGEYLATYAQQGRAKGDRLQKTLVLTDVKTPGGDPVTDHVWLIHTKEWNRVAPGSQVRFTAPVQAYFKNRGKGLLGEIARREMDYGFSRPLEVKAASAYQAYLAWVGGTLK
jgi:hypothetical protein